MITLSENAAGKLAGVMQEKGLDSEHALRVFVKRGGCGGMQYGMTFDQAREGDEVYEQHGLRVLVDSTSLFYIEGATIDYVDNLMGGGPAGHIVVRVRQQLPHRAVAHGRRNARVVRPRALIHELKPGLRRRNQRAAQLRLLHRQA